MAMGPVLDSEFLQMVYVLFHFIKDKPTHRNKNTKRQTQTQKSEAVRQQIGVKLEV